MIMLRADGDCARPPYAASWGSSAFLNEKKSEDKLAAVRKREEEKSSVMANLIGTHEPPFMLREEIEAKLNFPYSIFQSLFWWIGLFDRQGSA